ADDVKDSRTDDAWSGDLSALIRLKKDDNGRWNAFNFYANWKSSFKPAAPNVLEPEGLKILAPERTHSIEGGFKARAFDRRLSFDVSLFQMDFTNTVVAILGPGGHGELTNAGRE